MSRIVRTAPSLLVTVIALTVLTLTPIAQERDRSKIADRYTWNLADLYPSDAAWRTAQARGAAELPQLLQQRGTLTSSARTLADALEKKSAIEKELSRLYVYAS